MPVGAADAAPVVVAVLAVAALAGALPGALEPEAELLPVLLLVLQRLVRPVNVGDPVANLQDLAALVALAKGILPVYASTGGFSCKPKKQK